MRDLPQIFVSAVKVQIEAMLPLPLSTECRDQSCGARVQGGSLLDKAVVSWIQCQAWNKLTSLTFIHQHAWNSPLYQVPCLAPGAQRCTYPHPLRDSQFLEELATIQAMASAQVRALFLRIMISHVSGGFPHRGKYFKYVSARDSLGQNVVFPSNGKVVLYCNQAN